MLIGRSQTFKTRRMSTKAKSILSGHLSDIKDSTKPPKIMPRGDLRMKYRVGGFMMTYIRSWKFWNTSSALFLTFQQKGAVEIFKWGVIFGTERSRKTISRLDFKFMPLLSFTWKGYVEEWSLYGYSIEFRKAIFDAKHWNISVAGILFIP